MPPDNVRPGIATRLAVDDGHARRRAERRALAALVGGAAIIGVSPLLVRASEVGPVATAFWRVALAIPLLWAWRIRERRGRREDRTAASTASTTGAASTASAASAASAASVASAASAAPSESTAGLALAGLFFAADLAIWHTSLGLTSVANSTFLVNMAPVMVAIIGWLLWREKPGTAFALGAAISLVGALALMRASWSHSARETWGDVVALGAAFALAGYMIVVGRLRARHSTAQVMLASSVACALALLPLTVAIGEGALWPTAIRGWVVVALLAVACHAGGQGLIAYSLARLPAAFSSLALLVEPVVAAALAWVLFGEAMDALQIAGGAAVLGGIALARPREPRGRGGNDVRST